MTKTILTLKASAYVCMCVFFGAGTYLFISVGHSVNSITQAVNKITIPLTQSAQALTPAIEQAKTTLADTDARLNKNNGVLNGIYKAVQAYKGIGVETSMAEKQYYAILQQNTVTLFGQITQAIGNINTTVKHVDLTLGDLQADLEAGKPALIETQTSLVALTKLLNDLDANMANSPDVKQILANMNELIAHGSGVMLDAQKISDFLAAKITAKPTFKSRLAGWIQMSYYLTVLGSSLGNALH